MNGIAQKGTSLLIHAHNRRTRHDSYTANHISCLSEKILVYYINILLEYLPRNRISNGESLLTMGKIVKQ